MAPLDILSPMPWFYFNLHECGTIIEDEEGRDVADLETARAKAVDDARQVMSAEVRSGTLCLACCVVVEDADHHEVARIPFQEALTITGL